MKRKKEKGFKVNKADMYQQNLDTYGKTMIGKANEDNARLGYDSFGNKNRDMGMHETC